MIPWKLPEGTTREQWERYEQDVVKHKEFIDNYKFFLYRICRHLDFIGQPDELWTTEEIIKRVLSEIEKAQSMDAPNKPGYYRANND